MVLTEKQHHASVAPGANQYKAAGAVLPGTPPHITTSCTPKSHLTNVRSAPQQSSIPGGLWPTQPHTLSKNLKEKEPQRASLAHLGFTQVRS